MHLRHRSALSGPQSSLIVAAAVIIGIAGLAISLAAGSFFGTESESGSLGSGAAVVIDSSASGGKAVQFASAPTPSPTASPNCLKVVWPPYFYPDLQWTTAINSLPSGSFLILDISGSGAGSNKDSTFVPYVQAAQAKGIKVLGYSDTTYGARATATVETDVQNYKAWYGVTDVFLDQGAPDAAHLSYYQTLYNYIHNFTPGSSVMINPGVYPDESYTSVSDELMVFEDTYANYLNASVPSWVTKYPASHFVHTVHDTSTSQYANALSLARSRHVGYVYITNGTGANPYSALPSYWSGEISNITAGCP